MPPINRQIMDLWFTVVYLLDDFEPRRIAYEKGAYRELRKTLVAEFAKKVETQLPLSDEEKRNPNSIPSWPHLTHYLRRLQGAKTS